MLTEQPCSLIKTALCEDAEPRKAAACLCLHTGFMPGAIPAFTKVQSGSIYNRELTVQPAYEREQLCIRGF